MAVHGIADIYCNPASTNNGFNEIYVSLTRFMTSSYAAACGIQRIAYSTGSSAGNGAAVGNGEGYWNSGNRAGQNAFSVYRFMSASVPFNILIQYVDSGQSVTWGTLPGNPAVLGNGSTGLGFAAAGKADGTNAWAGTTGSIGRDTKASVVWASGSSTLYVFGRGNTGGGTYAANKQLTDQMVTIYNGSTFTAQTRCHLIVDENNFCFLSYYPGGTQYSMTYFGKYTPRSGTTATFPYVYLNSERGSAVVPLIILTNTYGSTAGTATREGAIAHPNPPSSSQTTMIAGISWYNDSQVVTHQPNAHVNGQPTFEEHPIHVFAYETSYYGYAGYVDWIKEAYNMNNNSISSDGSRAYFGTDTRAALKVSVPWSGSVGMPGYRINREGVMF